MSNWYRHIEIRKRTKNFLKQLSVEICQAAKNGPLWLSIFYVLSLRGPLRPLFHFLGGLSSAKVEFQSLPVGAFLWIVAEPFITGFVFPIILIMSSNLTLWDVGLRVPRKRELYPTVISVIFFIPIGFWLSKIIINPWRSIIYEFVELLSMIPEHFLVFGVIIGLIVPMNDRIVNSSPALRKFFAVILAGSVFGLIHIGYSSHIETLVSFPVGLAFAFLTLYSMSIWPAIVIHWLLNVIPMVAERSF